MSNFHFQTSISNDKIIHLPDDFELINQDVEVLIYTKEKKDVKSVSAFLDKWSGFFKEEELNDKYNYLMEKYK